MSITINDINAGGMTFRARVAGGSGEPVILLHGFPETSHMYLPMLARLEAEGYRAVAPNQRGYSPGARPEGKENYTYGHIAGDVIAIADTLGFDRFHLVGHDWGAGAGWAAIDLYPERITSWTALSVPHVAAFGRAIRDNPDQQQRSTYINLFVQEGVAESALSGNDFETLKGVWSASPPEQVEEYLDLFRQPGALTAALNWYRGSRGIDPDDAEVAFGPVSTPTLLIWGNQDGAIGRVGVENAAALMTGPYKFVELDAGHWLIQEAPDQVIGETLAHIKANPIS